MTFVSQEFISQVQNLYGARGEKWLSDLPQRLEAVQRRFDVRLVSPFPGLSWNLLLEANTRDECQVVVKLAVEMEELIREISALRAYAGRGGVRVLDADEDLGAAVLERVHPGTRLSDIEDDALATEAFCEVMQRLRCAPDAGPYVSINRHFAALDRYQNQYGDGQGPLPSQWMEQAHSTLASLLSSTTETVLLHGDLHHENILRHGETGWAVIDPKGIIGDPHFEPIQYLLNYEDRGGDPLTVLQRRIRIIAKDTGLDPRRIAQWGVARGVLEACWSVEDGKEDWRTGIDIAGRFAVCVDLF